MPDTAHVTHGDLGTPIYDAVLADRLQAAALSVAQAERDATTFRAALDRGQVHALEQLTERRARELVTAQTLTVTTQRDLHERQARVVGDRLAGLAAWHTGDDICRACGEAMPCMTTQVLAGTAAPRLLAEPPPGTAPADPEPAPAHDEPPAVAVVTLEAQAVAAEQSRVEATATADGEPSTPTTPASPPRSTPPPATPLPAAEQRPAAIARDGGPAAGDVPSVPSMKDLFSSTRAASWLDNLLGARR